jgi:hypothetical protein
MFVSIAIDVIYAQSACVFETAFRTLNVLPFAVIGKRLDFQNVYVLLGG